MKRFGAVSLLAVLLAFGAQAAPVSAHTQYSYTTQYCLSHPNTAGCPVAISAFVKAAAKAAAAAAAARACTPKGSAHCQALVAAAKAAIAAAAALAAKAHVPYTVPSTGGGGVYLSTHAAPQNVVSGVTTGSSSQVSAANQAVALPTTGGGSPASPLGGIGLVLATLLATLGLALRRMTR